MSDGLFNATEPAPSAPAMERHRRHRITIDLFDWHGDDADPSKGEYAVTITIDEAKMGALVAAAIKRHDGRATVGGGAVVVEAKKIKG